MKINHKNALLAATLTVLLSGISCGRPQPSGTKIGVILPLTGILSEMGQYEKQAMDLALETVPKSGGQPFELIYEDGKGDNKTVASAALKLLDVDRVGMLITSTTGASLTTRPIAEQRQIPLLAFCMGSDIAPESQSTVRFYIGIAEESRALIADLSSLPADTRIGVLHASVAVWTNAIKEIYQPFFNQHFTAPVSIEEYNLNDRDFRAQLTRLKQAQIKVLLILGYGFEYEPMFRQMKDLRVTDGVRILGGWGFLYTSVPANDLEGVRVAGPTYVFKKGAAGSEFTAAFTRRYSRPPNFDAAFAYEVIRRLPDLLAIIQRSRLAGLKQALVGEGTIDGVMGPYHFAPTGDMIVDTAVGTYHKGVIVGQ